MGGTESHPSLVVSHRPSILVLASQISAAMIHGIVKVLEGGTQPVHPFEILLVRLLITGVSSTLYLWSRGVPDFPLGPRDARVLLMLRALGGVCGAIGFYCTVHEDFQPTDHLTVCVEWAADIIPVSILYLTLAQATALNFLAPLGAMVLARYLDLGSLSLADRVGGLVALVGVVLVMQPDNIFVRGDKPLSRIIHETPESLKGVAYGIVGVFGGIVSSNCNHRSLVRGSD